MTRASLYDVVAAPARPRRPVVEVGKLTVDLPTDLIRVLKRHAVDSGVSMKHVVEVALRDHLTKEGAS